MFIIQKHESAERLGPNCGNKDFFFSSVPHQHINKDLTTAFFKPGMLCLTTEKNLKH